MMKRQAMIMIKMRRRRRTVGDKLQVMAAALPHVETTRQSRQLTVDQLACRLTHRPAFRRHF
jgi:hypothetical protein